MLILHKQSDWDTVERVIFVGANFREKLIRVVRNNFRGSKFRGDSIVYADDVIRSLRLTVSARSSREVSQKDGPPLSIE